MIRSVLCVPEFFVTQRTRSPDSYRDARRTQSLILTFKRQHLLVTIFKTVVFFVVRSVLCAPEFFVSQRTQSPDSYRDALSAQKFFLTFNK